MNFKTRLPLLVLICSLMVGCATKRIAGWNKATNSTTLSSKDEKALFKTAMKNWEKRDQKEQLVKSLKSLETLAISSPGNYEYLVYLCRGKYILADGHIDDMEEKKRLWEEGVTWGEKAMATNSDFAAKIKLVEGKVEAALDTLTKNEIESIYWTAVNLGKWGKNSGIATILKYKTRIKKMINKVGELDKDFFHGAFHRYWGAYYAAAPSFAGGDINKSFDSFTKAIKAEKNYLGSYVLFASYYATKKGNKKLFQEKLNYVLNAKSDIIDDITPENNIEKNKAKKLLSNIDELF